MQSADMNRRQALALLGTSALFSSACHPSSLVKAGWTHLTAQDATVQPFGSVMKPLQGWGYNGRVAGPSLRLKRGERLKVRFENKLPQPTSVHWHGLRIPNAMDGVGSITQPGIQNGETFDYEFEAPDSGLFWYHPHMNSEKQIAKGLFGAILVEDEDAPIVDRDLVWTLFDWGLTENYEFPEDRAYAVWRGRKKYAFKTKITTDGVNAPPLQLMKGERVRIRLCNTSSTRRYALKFEGHDPHIIALDGNAVEPFQLGGQPIMVGNGERVDIILDGTGSTGASYNVVNVFENIYHPELPPENICQIHYASERTLRSVSELPTVTAPAPNHIPQPDLDQAEVIDLSLDQNMHKIGDIPQIGRAGKLLAATHGVPADTIVPVWSMNGKVLFEDLTTFRCAEAPPLFTCVHNKSYVLRFTNNTPTDHPMHLHGHTYLMLRKNGVPYPRKMWRDTFMVMQGETVEVAFKADNPGDWMVHCHRGLHSHGGMMGSFRVA